MTEENKNRLASIAAEITRLRNENIFIKEQAKDLCWQVWNMWNPYNSDLTLEGTIKGEQHMNDFEDWWKGKQLELTKSSTEAQSAGG